MSGGIELVKAEGEVERIDVFERRREKCEMSGEKHRGEAAGPEQFGLQTCRRINPSFKLPVR